MNDAEVWQPVHGLEDFYLVSNVGRIWSLINDQPMRLSLLGGRYVAVELKGKMRKVHHLVAEAFICPRPDGMLCLHRDDDRFNNTLKTFTGN